MCGQVISIHEALKGITTCIETLNRTRHHNKTSSPCPPPNHNLPRSTSRPQPPPQPPSNPPHNTPQALQQPPHPVPEAFQHRLDQPSSMRCAPLQQLHHQLSQLGATNPGRVHTRSHEPQDEQLRQSRRTVMEDLQVRHTARPGPRTRPRSRGNRIGKRPFGDGAIVARLKDFGRLSRYQGSNGSQGLGQRLDAGETHTPMLRRYLGGGKVCLGLCGDGVKARESHELLVRRGLQEVVCWPCAVIGPESVESDSVLHADFEVRLLAKGHAVSEVQNFSCVRVGRGWVDGKVLGSYFGAVWVFFGEVGAVEGCHLCEDG